jgi:hypothetical protein
MARVAAPSMLTDSTTPIYSTDLAVVGCISIEGYGYSCFLGIAMRVWLLGARWDKLSPY